MKSLKILLVMAVVLLMACNEGFLDRPDLDNPNIEYLQGGDENLIKLTNAAYSSLQKSGLYGRTASQLPQTRSDESRITKNTPKMEEDGVAAGTYTNNASGKMGEMVWCDCYNGIYRANVVIDVVAENTSASEEIKVRLLGEAHFLRAFYYFHLVLHFGEIIPDNVSSGVILGAPFESVDAAWQLIIKDLKTAQSNFTTVNFTNATWNDSDRGRANLGAATGLLSKVYLYYAQLHQNNSAVYLNLAKTELLKIYNQQAGTYELQPNFRDNFTDEMEYNNESLFEISFADFGTGTWVVDQDNSGAVETSRMAKNATLCDGIGEMWWNEAPTTRILNEFERDQAGNILDYRLYYTIWFPEGAYFNDCFANQNGTVEDRVVKYNDMPWPGLDNSPSSTKWGKEYNNYRFYGWRKYGFDFNFWLKNGVPADHVGSEINVRYLRYADVLLMLAECEFYTGGNPQPYINMVRSRANNTIADQNQSVWGNSSLPYLSTQGQLPMVENSVFASNMEAAIQHERMVELAGEFSRYFDIIRWNAAGLLLDLRKENFPKAIINEIIIDPAFTGKTLMPIPQSELNNNPKMVPNSAN